MSESASIMITLHSLQYLADWTPFLFGGFIWNILIAIFAAFIGVIVAVPLLRMQQSSSSFVQKLSIRLSALFHRLPTLALMFYIAILIPNEFNWMDGDNSYQVPSWIKAGLALSIAQIGFTVQNLQIALVKWHAHDRGTALLFIANWGNNFIITIIASSSASLIGVSELVSRCNKLINAGDNLDMILPIYLYACLIFMSFCFPLTCLLQRLTRAISSKYHRISQHESALIHQARK